MTDANRPQGAAHVPGAPATRPDDQRLDQRQGQAARPAKPNLERAHKTVIGTAEAIPGAPRSGSA